LIAAKPSAAIAATKTRTSHVARPLDLPLVSGERIARDCAAGYSPLLTKENWRRCPGFFRKMSSRDGVQPVARVPNANRRRRAGDIASLAGASPVIV
jgi:hypothetical protein